MEKSWRVWVYIGWGIGEVGVCEQHVVKADDLQAVQQEWLQCDGSFHCVVAWLCVLPSGGCRKYLYVLPTFIQITL